MPKNPYLNELKKIVLDYFENDDVHIVLFGSRARNDYTEISDIDIGIGERHKNNVLSKEIQLKISLLRENIENSNIPYKVDVVNLSEVSKDFLQEIMKDAKTWKD